MYGPILHLPFKSRTNLRNHRKMLVADGVRLWCGGRNFAAEYFEGVRKREPWRDLSFDLEGRSQPRRATQGCYRPKLSVWLPVATPQAGRSCAEP